MIWLGVSIEHRMAPLLALLIIHRLLFGKPEQLRCMNGRNRPLPIRLENRWPIIEIPSVPTMKSPSSTDIAWNRWGNIQHRSVPKTTTPQSPMWRTCTWTIQMTTRSRANVMIRRKYGNVDRVSWLRTPVDWWPWEPYGHRRRSTSICPPLMSTIWWTTFVEWKPPISVSLQKRSIKNWPTNTSSTSRKYVSFPFYRWNAERLFSCHSVFDSACVTKTQVAHVEKLIEPYADQIRTHQAELTRLDNPMRFVIKPMNNDVPLVTIPREYNDCMITLVTQTDPLRKSELVSKLVQDHFLDDVKANSLDIR